MISEERLLELWIENENDNFKGGITSFARAVEAEATADLRAENERLRALLQEAAPWLRPSEDSPPELDVLHARIDAALAAGGKT